MVGNYRVITLCGSTRFKDEFIEAQKKLTLAGNIVKVLLIAAAGLGLGIFGCVIAVADDLICFCRFRVDVVKINISAHVFAQSEIAHKSPRPTT